MTPPKKKIIRTPPTHGLFGKIKPAAKAETNPASKPVRGKAVTRAGAKSTVSKTATQSSCNCVRMLAC